jgi:hypothetical protein
MRILGVCRVAIERPGGLLVERLMEAGFAVLPVHPNKLAATRPRYEVSGGKSDGFDAFAWRSWRAPTLIACGFCVRTPMRPRRCGR